MSEVNIDSKFWHPRTIRTETQRTQVMVCFKRVVFQKKTLLNVFFFFMELLESIATEEDRYGRVDFSILIAFSYFWSNTFVKLSAKTIKKSNRTSLQKNGMTEQISGVAMAKYQPEEFSGQEAVYVLFKAQEDQQKEQKKLVVLRNEKTTDLNFHERSQAGRNGEKGISTTSFSETRLFCGT